VISAGPTYMAQRSTSLFARRGAVAGFMRPAEQREWLCNSPGSTAVTDACCQELAELGLVEIGGQVLLVIAGRMEQETSASGLAALSREFRHQLADIRKAAPLAPSRWRGVRRVLRVRRRPGEVKRITKSCGRPAYVRVPCWVSIGLAHVSRRPR
jgi:hypothetical protein